MSGTIIATNVPALNAHRSLKNVDSLAATASERLSGGLRINRAADDASGLAISEKMKAQIRGLNQAQRNTQDGISLIITMEGGMNEIQEMMRRQRTLLIQGLNDTNTDEDRDMMQLEIDQLTAEIGGIAERTTFNTIPLLNVPQEATSVSMNMLKGEAASLSMNMLQEEANISLIDQTFASVSGIAPFSIPSLLDTRPIPTVALIEFNNLQNGDICSEATPTWTFNNNIPK